MSKLSRDKGARGELEWAAFMREQWGCTDAHRGRQYHGGADSPDCAGGIDGTHVEVKRTERVNIHEAIKQAKADAGDGEVPFVATRRNREDWLLVIPAARMVEFARLLLYKVKVGPPRCEACIAKRKEERKKAAKAGV